VIAGSILVGVGALLVGVGALLVGVGALAHLVSGGVLAVVGSVIGVYGLYQWFADVRLVRKAAADRVMKERVQEFREEHERSTSGS